MKTLERRFRTWKSKHVSNSMLVYPNGDKIIFRQPPFPYSSHDIHPRNKSPHRRIDGSFSGSTGLNSGKWPYTMDTELTPGGRTPFLLGRLKGWWFRNPRELTRCFLVKISHYLPGFRSSQVVVWDFWNQQSVWKKKTRYRWWWKFAPLNNENSIVLLKPIWTKISSSNKGHLPQRFRFKKKILKARDTSIEESKRDRAGWILDGQEPRILQNHSVLRWISLWIGTVHYSLVCWNTQLALFPNTCY